MGFEPIAVARTARTRRLGCREHGVRVGGLLPEGARVEVTAGDADNAADRKAIRGGQRYQGRQEIAAGQITRRPKDQQVAPGPSGTGGLG
jgi:hypothetical protein